MDKTKSILSSPKHRWISVGQIDISYKDAKIKQYSKVTYLGCVLDECLTGQSMAKRISTKVTSLLKFLCRKNWFLSKDLGRLLRSTLIQLHFNYAFAGWYPNLNKKIQKQFAGFTKQVYTFLLKTEQPRAHQN